MVIPYLETRAKNSALSELLHRFFRQWLQNSRSLREAAVILVLMDLHKTQRQEFTFICVRRGDKLMALKENGSSNS
jgi:hypothetical protein